MFWSSGGKETNIPLAAFFNRKVEWLIIKEGQKVIYFVGTMMLSVRTTQRAPTQVKNPC